jgi:hypothetical protein
MTVAELACNVYEAYKIRNEEWFLWRKYLDYYLLDVFY